MRVHAVIESSDNQFQQYWDKLIASDPLQNPLYAPPVSLSAKSAVDTDRYQNHSFMVVREEEPVFGCSVTSNTDANGRRRLGFYGREASTLMNRGQMAAPSNSFAPEAIELLMEHFTKLMQDISPDVLEYLDPVSCGLMSPLTQVLLEKGARPHIHKSQVIRLGLSESALLACMDSEYSRQIKWGAEHIAMRTLAGERTGEVDSILTELCNAYCANIECGQAFFHSCANLISNRQGFIVQSGLESNDRALFVHNSHTCHLVIADTPGQSENLPALQAILWQAICYSKLSGCTYFDLGGKLIPSSEFDLKKFGGSEHTKIRVSYSQ